MTTHYKTGNYQVGSGDHHPIMPDDSIIVRHNEQTATFPVRLAKNGTVVSVLCTQGNPGIWTGGYEEPDSDYEEDYTFSNFPQNPGGLPVTAARTDPLHLYPDNDTGTFTATEVPPPIE